MTTPNEELRARLLAAWKDGRIVNMPKPGEPGKRVVGYVIEWDESFPMLPGAIIAALARQEEGREAVGDVGMSILHRDDTTEVGDETAVFTHAFLERLASIAPARVKLYTHPTPPIAALAPHSGGEVGKPSDAAIADAFWAARARINTTPSCFVDPAEVRWGDEIVRAARLATPTPQAAGVSEEIVERAMDAFCDEPGSWLRDSMRAALEAVWPTAAGAAPEGWQAKAHELLDRLAKASPPNVLHQQLTILGDMAALLRCMYPQQPGAQEKA